jgi:hypothetical protein
MATEPDLPSPLAPTRVHLNPSRANKNQKWSVAEDAALTAIVGGLEEIEWAAVAAQFPDKTQQQVVERWTKVLDPHLTKGSWTRAEDQAIIEFVNTRGTRSWSKLAVLLPGRVGKQCRERWINHLNPSISHAAFTPEDDAAITELHRVYGNKWAKIAGIMATRSSNAIKNRWNSVLSKRGPPDGAAPHAPGAEAAPELLELPPAMGAPERTGGPDGAPLADTGPTL